MGLNHLFERLALARKLRMTVPDYLRLYAVEVAGPYTFKTEMTDPVVVAVPEIVKAIVDAEFLEAPTDAIVSTRTTTLTGVTPPIHAGPEFDKRSIPSESHRYH